MNNDGYNRRMKQSVDLLVKILLVFIYTTNFTTNGAP